MKHHNIGLGFVFALGIAAPSFGQQAVQWRVEEGGNGHWYSFSTQSLSWTAARDLAVSKGGHLVTTTSEAESLFVFSIDPDFTSSQYWLGLYRSDGIWRWVTGEAVEYVAWNCHHCHPSCQPDWTHENYVNAMCWDGSTVRWNNFTNGPISHFGLMIEWSADCNSDGVVDYGQILDGTLSDLDGDGVPDECEYGYLVGTAGFEAIPPLPLREFDIGEGSAVGIRTDGAVLSFLGGSTQTASGPFATTSAGLGFVVAIRADGTLLGLGDNAFGRLNVPAGTFRRVSAADATWHVAAIRTDGAADCWGYNNYGQANAPSGSFAAIAAGGHQSWSGFTVAARVDGSLVGWGNNTWGQRNVPAGNVFRTVAAGYYHALAIRFDGTLAGWGYNVNGQCVVPPGQFIDVACGSNESVALRLDGTVATFGSLQPSASALFAGRTGVVSVRTLCCGSAALLESRDCDENGINDAIMIALDPLRDANANGVPDCCDQGIECDCPTDINQSGTVDAEDLAQVLFAWGMTGGKAGGADINGDAIVDANDLSLVLGSWGPCPN